MGWMDKLRNVFGGAPAPPPKVRVPLPDPEPEPVVPELTPEALRAALAGDAAPLVLDVREPYEWRQVRMPGARHIPMNDVPSQVGELPKDRPIVVLCAHGSRSYGVAAWLLEQGFQAANLSGGITRWAKSGGDVEQG
jgi:rhodanese-related sulfurtransferase